MELSFEALPSQVVRDLQTGGRDAHGQRPETSVSDGAGVPCRHCLRPVPAGHRFLILAHRPFPAAQPYAETGPIFLCAEPCDRHPDGPDLPPILLDSPGFLMRGYDGDHRIAYGTGGVVARDDIRRRAAAILSDPGVAYVHVRSARNNCYQLRIGRGRSGRA